MAYGVVAFDGRPVQGRDVLLVSEGRVALPGVEELLHCGDLAESRERHNVLGGWYGRLCSRVGGVVGHGGGALKILEYCGGSGC